MGCGCGGRQSKQTASINGREYVAESGIKYRHYAADVPQDVAPDDPDAGYRQYNNPKDAEAAVQYGGFVRRYDVARGSFLPDSD